MPSGFKCISASAALTDLDNIFAARTTTARSNTGFKVESQDLSVRYETSIDGSTDIIGFNTFFKSGSTDLRYLFKNINYVDFYNLDVVSGTGGGSQPVGFSYNISANSVTGYSFSNWVENYGDITFGNINNASTTATITEDSEAEATYNINQYTLTVNSGTGGGTQNYLHTYNIVAGSNTGYTFANWQTNAGSISYGNINSSTTTATIGAANATTTALYNINQYTLTVVDGTGGGTQNYLHTYTINGTDYEGYTFAGWQVKEGTVSFANQSADTTTCTIGANNAEVEATYNINQYTLTVIFGTGGGTEDYQFTYNIVAGEYEGYTFTNWQTNAGSISYGDINSASTTATIGSANATTEAIYNINQYTLTVIFGTGGGTENYGHTYNIVAGEYEGYTFSYWQVNSGTATFGDSNSASTTCTIGSNNATIEAIYTED